MKTKLTLFAAILAVALFGTGCASSLKEGLVYQYSFDRGAVVSEKDSVSVDVKELPDGNEPRTFSIWVRSEKSYTHYVMIARFDTGNIDGTGKHFGFSYRNTVWGWTHRDDLQSNTQLPSEQKTHMVLVYNGENFQIFIDGELKGEKKVALQTNPAKGIVLGGSTSQHKPFVGSIDDVRIYNRALSAEEVKALYDLEKPKGK